MLCSAKVGQIFHERLNNLHIGEPVSLVAPITPNKYRCNVHVNDTDLVNRPQLTAVG